MIVRASEKVPPLERVIVVEFGVTVTGEVAGTRLTRSDTEPAKLFKLARLRLVRSEEPAATARDVLAGAIEKSGPVTFSDTNSVWTREQGLAAVMKRV